MVYDLIASVLVVALLIILYDNELVNTGLGVKSSKMGLRVIPTPW